MNHIRQGQNNNSKRSRGRGRKPQNSGNRAYDSNGPDVKIRGTATHVCEKYQQLARDAITSGDRVMAENYYQHAEHYYRLIMAAQSPNDGQPRPQNALGYRPDEDQDYDDEDAANDPAQPQAANQPYHQQSGGGQQRNNNNGNGRNNNNGNGRNNRNGRDETPRAAEGEPSATGVEGSPAPSISESDQPEVVAEGDVAAASANPGSEAPNESEAPDASEAPRRPRTRRRRPRSDAAASGDGAEAGDAKASDNADEVPV